MVPPDQDIPVDPLDEELAERGRALIAAAVAETMAPLALRERIEADRARAGQAAARGARAACWARSLPAGGLVAAAVVALRARRRRRRERPERARDRLAGHAAARCCPRRPRTSPTAPCSRRRWRACPSPTGATRSSGRPSARATTRSRTASAKTVFYDNPKGARAAYTILGGDTIDAPSGAYEKDMNGVKLFITTDNGRRIVTWTRNGHTCVLSAPLAVPEQKLLELAAWKGKGNVPF